MIFLTVELILTSLRFYQQKSTSSLASIIPEEMRTMMSAVGLPTQSLNTWASVFDTLNGYRSIITSLFHDVLLFVFFFGSLVMISDLLV